jgi:hypothetical protein
MAPAIATTWYPVATEGSQTQYVDLDSVQRSGAIVRLKTYWTDAQTPDAVTSAVTEYDCDRQQYRDLTFDGHPQNAPWQANGADALNQAVMEFACQNSQAKSTVPGVMQFSRGIQ